MKSALKQKWKLLQGDSWPFIADESNQRIIPQRIGERQFRAAQRHIIALHNASLKGRRK